MDDNQAANRQATPPDLGILLSAGIRGFVDLLHAELSVRGFEDVRPAYGVVFRALRDGPQTLTSLAARLGVTKQAASKVVNEMDAKRLLRRRSDRRDGRTKQLELTARGRKAMETAIVIGNEIEQRLEHLTSRADLERTKTVLAAFVELAGGAEALADRRSRASW